MSNRNMLYVRQSLSPGEELIHVGHFHWMYTLGAIMDIFWGIAGCVGMLWASVYVQTKFGFGPEMMPDSSPIETIRQLHPGLRLVSFLVFVMGLLGFAKRMVIKASTEIAITNSRLIFKRGIVARSVGEMSIDRIEGVNVLQSILGRMLGYGRIMIRGMGVGEVVLPPLENPIAFRKAIETARTS